MAQTPLRIEFPGSLGLRTSLSIHRTSCGSPPRDVPTGRAMTHKLATISTLRRGNRETVGETGPDQSGARTECPAPAANTTRIYPRGSEGPSAHGGPLGDFQIQCCVAQLAATALQKHCRTVHTGYFANVRAAVVDLGLAPFCTLSRR